MERKPANVSDNRLEIAGEPLRATCAVWMDPYGRAKNSKLSSCARNLWWKMKLADEKAQW